MWGRGFQLCGYFLSRTPRSRDTAPSQPTSRYQSTSIRQNVSLIRYVLRRKILVSLWEIPNIILLSLTVGPPTYVRFAASLVIRRRKLSWGPVTWPRNMTSLLANPTNHPLCRSKIRSLSFLQCVDFPVGDCEWKSNTRITMTTRKRRMTSAQILQEILNSSDSDIADAESIFWVIKCQKWYYESSGWNESEADDGRMDNNSPVFWLPWLPSLNETIPYDLQWT